MHYSWHAKRHRKPTERDSRTLDEMVARIHRLLLEMYGRLPTGPRRWAVRMIAPSYTVGAICVIERPDGAVLLVRQAYRKSWGIPGGLLKRGEDAADAAKREVLEEVGFEVELMGEPAIVVDPVPQRIDIIFRARPSNHADIGEMRPSTPEIVEAKWFAPTELPELQFETANALVSLARSARSPQALPLTDPNSRAVRDL